FGWMMGIIKKRSSSFSSMSMSFLDVMSCGFGSVVLIFLILDHQPSDQIQADPALMSEVRLLQQDIQDGQANLVQVRNTLSDVNLEVVEAQGLADRIQTEITDFLEQLANLENSMASEESLEQLRAEIRSMEDELQRLQSSAVEDTGLSASAFVGEGNRQYLTGMFLGGNRIMILIDTSSSMLDETLVNILRTRNMPDDSKRQAAKWQRAVRTVEWISSKMPVASQYQIYGFNADFSAALPGTEGTWLEVADRDELERSLEGVKNFIPT